MAIKKRIDVRDERVRVTARFREEGSVLRGDARGWSEGFSIEITLASDAPEAEIAELLRLAHRMCFTEDVISRAIDVDVRHVLNGDEIAVT